MFDVADRLEVCRWWMARAEHSVKRRPADPVEQPHPPTSMSGSEPSSFARLISERCRGRLGLADVTCIPRLPAGCIHVTRNIVERWMGLAKVPIQTASGTSGATMEIVGIRDPEPLRDFLYERMRGARAEVHEQVGGQAGEDEMLSVLEEIRDAVKEHRRARESAP